MIPLHASVAGGRTMTLNDTHTARRRHFCALRMLSSLSSASPSQKNAPSSPADFPDPLGNYSIGYCYGHIADFCRVTAPSGAKHRKLLGSASPRERQLGGVSCRTQEYLDGIRGKGGERDRGMPLRPWFAPRQVLWQGLHQAIPASHILVDLHRGAVNSTETKANAIDVKQVALEDRCANHLRPWDSGNFSPFSSQVPDGETGRIRSNRITIVCRAWWNASRLVPTQPFNIQADLLH